MEPGLGSEGRTGLEKDKDLAISGPREMKMGRGGDENLQREWPE